MSEVIQMENNDTGSELLGTIASEEQTSMKKNNKSATVLICCVLCAVLFACCGFFSVRYALSHGLFIEEDKVSYTMHVYDGEVEIFNGSAWVKAGNVKSLASLDPFYEASILNFEKTETTVLQTPIRKSGVVVVEAPRRTYYPSQGGSTPVVSEPEWTDDYL